MYTKTALIFAGGTGTRMKTSGTPKQFLELHGKPIIIYTLEKFEQCDHIDNIAVVCIEDWIPHLKKLLKKFEIKKVKYIVKGGTTSQESTLNGINAIAGSQNPEKTIVLIHDGVRPLINDKLIKDNINSVLTYGNAITVVSAIETIITSKDKKNIDNIINRDDCYLARAPQSFYLSDIMSAHQKALSENYTKMIDSASLMLHYGKKLHMVQGPVENIKITNPSDFYIFKAMIELQENIDIWGA
ncbi:MAG: IspD/TarI family cytidylyltransferase [Candidatus Fimenecus sp.]